MEILMHSRGPMAGGHVRRGLGEDFPKIKV
jgi:hypothetical protein